MNSISEKLRFRYFLFLFSVVFTIVISQLIIQYDLELQNEDARLINIAGRQRMLSQRISKLTLFLYYGHKEFSANEKRPGFYRLDSLNNLVQRWESAHEFLVKQNTGSRKSLAIDSLLAENTPRIGVIKRACEKILASPEPDVIKSAIDSIATVELPFLLTMEKTVSTYQREAEDKLRYIKKIELILALIAIGILSLQFVFIVFPALKKLDATNKDLSDLNRELSQTNSELAASEEEIRANLDQISALQSNLEASERQFREVVNDATDMIYELNENGKFSFVNPVMETVTGYTRAELQDKFYIDLIEKSEREKVFAFYQQQREKKQSVSYLEFRIHTKSGKQLWVGQNVKMFFNEQLVYRVSVVARDITKVKQAESQVARERMLLRTIIDNAPINIYVKDKSRRKIIANKAEYLFMGAANEAEVIGKSDADFYPSDFAKATQAEDDAVLNGSSIINKEVLSERRDGTKRWLLVSKLPLRDEEKNINGLVGISFDITDLKVAQQELARKEELYRLVSENSHDVISLHSLDGKFEYISPSCIELHGYTPEELIGKVGTEFMHPDDVKTTLQQVPEIQRKMSAGEPLAPMRFRLVSKHRGLVWVENVMKPLFTNGKLTGFQSTVRDISARKAYEEELQDAKTKAEQATLAKSQFLSMMSHEIRTPMNAIIGLTNLLLEENPAKEQMESLNLLKFSGENLLTIINDILDFSKIEADKVQLENEDFDIKDLVDKTVRMMKVRADEKGLPIALSYDPALPDFVKGDAVRIGQVLNNLLGNAIKFTEIGAVKLKVSKVANDKDDTTFQFEVLDSGIGIPANKLEHVFDSFSQASSDTTRKYGGTGLGLPITRKLIRLMGSEIFVDSTPGKGSRFYFQLTLSTGEKKKEKTFDTQNLVELIKQRGVKVLLVEDNKVNQIVATNFLKKWGIDITMANNGLEAIELIKTKSYDLVLMDIQMPEMNGYEATAHIRAMDDTYFKEIPIVALTASAMLEMRTRIHTVGMNDYVTKPFHPEELQRVIAKFIFKKNDSASLDFTTARIDEFTDGNKQYKSELIGHFLQNLDELHHALVETMATKNQEVFRAASHKSKTTLSMLDDQRLSKIVDELKESLKHDNWRSAQPLAKLLENHLKTAMENLQKERQLK